MIEGGSAIESDWILIKKKKKIDNVKTEPNNYGGDWEKIL